MSIRQLSPELLSKSMKELNEVPSQTSGDIEIIKKWMKQEPHLAHIKITDQRIVTFLRGTKFSLEKCKQKIDMYYTMRNLAPDLFSNRDPNDPTIQEILDLGVTLPLLETSGPTDPVVYMVRLAKYDPSKYNLSDIMKVSFMITDILLLENDNYVVSGQTLLLDLKGISMGVVGQFTPSLARKITTSTEKSYPIRQKENHMLHMPQGIEVVYNFFKSLLSEKNRKRIYLHSTNMKEFYKYIPQRIMPSDMEGNAISTKELIEYWKKKVESYRSWFLEDDVFKSNEKLRPGKPKTTEEMFGVNGSFRQLNID